MTNPRKIYWDSSCWICLLNPGEMVRRAICEDVLKHADLGTIEIWISTWAIVEVIRPKKPGNSPLPAWAVNCIAKVPEANPHIEELWRRFQASAPTPKLTPQQIAKIQGMFQWPYLHKVYVDERVANKAVELARDFGLKPGDSIHAASAILSKCDVLQAWDRDYDRIKHLIPVEEPTMISQQHSLTSAGLVLAIDSEAESAKEEEKSAQPNAESSEVQGRDSSSAGDPAGAEEKAKGQAE
jgi:predicted nucleic acid-binding protein